MLDMGLAKVYPCVAPTLFTFTSPVSRWKSAPHCCITLVKVYCSQNLSSSPGIDASVTNADVINVDFAAVCIHAVVSHNH